MKKSVLTAFVGAVMMGLALFTTDVSAATSCVAGKYLSGKTCKTCPDGQISAKGSTSCTTCSAGTYEQTHTKCTACPAGSYCVNGIKKACKDGYISGSNATSCTICAEGKYEKNNKTCEACPAGKYCTKGVKNDCDNDKQYCPANSSKPNACPANATCNGKTFTCKTGYEKEGSECIARCAVGQYFNTTKKTCMVCEEGYYCADGRNRKKCADGYISSSGKSACTVCAEGKYEKDNKTCVGCPEGKYCTKGVKNDCDDDKQYCPANSSKPIACPANATCNGKIFTCNKGYQEENGQCVGSCSAGQYFTSKGCQACDAGYYCPVGNKDKTACPAGTANPNTSAKDKSACVVCADNTYSAAHATSCSKKCDGKNQIVKADHTGCESCEAGFEPNEDHTECVVKCEVGQYYKITDTKKKTGKCVDCEAGYYCTNGKSKTACPKGTYNPSTKSTAASACLACDANKYTNTTGQKACSVCSGSNQIVKADHTGCESCKTGYKANSTHTTCETKCSAGQWWDTEKNKCAACSGNYYCPDGLEHKTCPKGQVPTADKKACEVKCEEGFFLNTSKRCEECPAGSYCKDGKKTACPKGQYQNQIGQSECKVCTENTYTGTTGAKKCTACTGSGKAIDAKHTSCTACPEDKEAKSDHTACVACSKVVYNGKCGACKANYPKKKAYACTSKDKPICDTKTGSCVACTANFGAKSGVTCDEELPVCQKGTCVASSCPTGAVCSNGAITGCKEGYLMSSDKKSCVACPANGVCSGGAVTTMSSCISGFELSSDKRNCIAVHAGDWCKTNFTMEKGAKDFCPIATPICKNSHCTKCTSDSDCLFDVGNGLHHEGARCENGTCTWAESIGCGDVNAEVNKQTLKCECKKGYVAKDGQCVLECNACQTLVNGSCRYKSPVMTTVCGEKCCSTSCNHNMTECCKNRTFGNKVEYKEGYRYSESTRYTVDSDSDMRLDISFVQIVGEYPRLSVCEVGGSCLGLTSGRATADNPGSIVRNLILKAGHTYDIDIDLYTKCGSCNMTAYCQGGSSNTKVCDASNLGQCQVCANNGVENKPDGSECHGDIGYCLKGQCVTCPNNAYYSSKEGTCICTNNMVMVDGQCVAKNCDEFPQIGDSCANSSCAYERLICQNGKWAPNCPDGYFYSYEGDTSFCVSNSKDCTGFELITGNRIIAADGARCGSDEQGVCRGGQCQICPDGYHFEGGHFCVNPDVCMGVIDLITGERNRAEEGESCQSSNGEGICQNGKCVKKQCPDKFVLRDGQCVAECLGVLGYSCKKCNPETGDWDPVTAENIRSDWGAFGSCRDGQFYPNCPDASSLPPCYFCDEKTGSVSVASDGYKCNGGQGTCLQGKCLVESPVRVAEVPATCGDGTYLNAGVCQVCPAGSYCKNGERKLCKAGTWNRRSGASSEDACVICAFGSQEGASTCGSMRRRS